MQTTEIFSSKAFHGWKIVAAAVLAYEAVAAASKSEKIHQVAPHEIPFITEKVRPQPSATRVLASVVSGTLIAQALRPLPKSIRYPVATIAALDLLDHFRPCRMGFWPFAETVA